MKILLIIAAGLILAALLAWRNVRRAERERRYENIRHWIDREGYARHPRAGYGNDEVAP